MSELAAAASGVCCAICGSAGWCEAGLLVEAAVSVLPAILRSRLTYSFPSVGETGSHELRSMLWINDVVVRQSSSLPFAVGQDWTALVGEAAWSEMSSDRGQRTLLQRRA
jgi:hypothetical protein